MAFHFALDIMDLFFLEHVPDTCFIKRAWTNCFYPHKESFRQLEIRRKEIKIQSGARHWEAGLAHMNAPFNGKN